MNKMKIFQGFFKKRNPGNRLSLTTQFKIKFLLTLTGCRKKLGEMPGCYISHFQEKGALLLRSDYFNELYF